MRGLGFGAIFDSDTRSLPNRSGSDRFVVRRKSEKTKIKTDVVHRRLQVSAAVWIPRRTKRNKANHTKTAKSPHLLDSVGYQNLEACITVLKKG
jgi:hypothetical protein